MSYTVQQLANIAGVSVRALHYYDHIGLLKPSYVKSNGYRQYEEAELLKLQQIMFFRELEFSLEDISNILKNPHFDMRRALEDHRRLIEIKRKRLDGLLKTIDNTIKKINKEKNMNDTELYDGFSKEESDAYAKEAKERWGNTEAYKQSQERYGKLSEEDKKRVHEAGDALLKEIVECMKAGIAPTDEKVQVLIARHYDGLRAFYEPNIEMYRGLASMYVDDARFTKFFEKYAVGFAVYMRDAMHAFCDTH